MPTFSSDTTWKFREKQYLADWSHMSRCKYPVAIFESARPLDSTLIILEEKEIVDPNQIFGAKVPQSPYRGKRTAACAFPIALQ
jgi:hypothetical protein